LPHVRVVHSTEYRYLNPVRPGAHRLMIRPRDSHDLRLLQTTMSVDPPAQRTRWAHDVFGNSVCYLDFAPESVTRHLRIVSTLDLRHYPTSTALPLDPMAEVFPFSYTSDEVPDLARSIERHYRDPDRLIDTWSHRFLASGGPTNTTELLSDMTSAIKAEFTYVSRQAEGTNTPLDTLGSRSGACRDLALFMVEAVRSLGLAARFVSGYLYDERLVDSGAPVVGGGATHAWCQVYLPGAGWVEYDPTNGFVAGRNLIRVCVARTPEQAVPISGSYFGQRGDFADMDVNVEVTVG